MYIPTTGVQRTYIYMTTALHSHIICSIYLFVMEGQCENDGNYNCLKENAEALLMLLDKHVSVQLIKNRSFIGYIHAIDPVTHSVILSVPHENSFQTTLIPGHAILEIIETPPTTDIKPPPRKMLPYSSKEEILEKKKKIMAWFKWNLLPVTECENKIVVGNANLLPPYNVTDICTDNPIVALQIKNIMDTMPQDFNPK